MMSVSVQAMGRQVAERLADAEDLANQSLRAHAALMQCMMDVRTKTEIAPYEGQIAVARVQMAMNKLVEAQGELAKAHKSLRADFCRITMIPDDGERCPTDPFVKAVDIAA